jgi:hypothetical protein
MMSKSSASRVKASVGRDTHRSTIPLEREIVSKTVIGDRLVPVCGRYPSQALAVAE